MAGPLAELNAETIRSTLSKEMPAHKCVLIGVNGEAKEVSVDMTPSKQEVAKLLGGELTFLGQYEPLEVFIVVLLHNEGLPVNRGKLPEPFKEVEVRGPILLSRSDEEGNPADFSLDEFNDFSKKAPEPWQLEALAEDEEEDYEEDDEDDDEEEDDSEDDDEEEVELDDDDEEEEDEGVAELVLNAALEQFETKNGRPATEAERASIETAITMRLGENAEEDDEKKAEMLVITKVCEAFEAEHGRPPTPTEVDGILEQLKRAEEPEEDENDGEESGVNKVLEELISMFKEKNGRDPNEDEIGQWIETIKTANLDLEAPHPEDSEAPASKRARTSTTK